MATTEEFRADLAEIVNEVAGVEADEVQLEEAFFDDLDVDSLSMVEVVVAAEENSASRSPTTRSGTWRRSATRSRSSSAPRAELPGGARPLSPLQPTLQHGSEQSSVASESSSPAWGPPTRSAVTSPSTWDALIHGRSGVQRIEADWAEELPVKIAGVAAVEPTEILERVKARRLDRSAQFAMVAAMEAWADSGLADARTSWTATGSAWRWPRASAGSSRC